MKNKPLLIAAICVEFGLEVNRMSETYVVCSIAGKGNGAIHIRIDSLIVDHKARNEFKGDLIELFLYIKNDEKFKSYKKYSFKSTITKCDQILSSLNENDLEVRFSKISRFSTNSDEYDPEKVRMIAKDKYDGLSVSVNKKWFDEGINEATQKKFGIRHLLNYERPRESRTVIPHYMWDEPDVIVGLKGRRILDGKEYEDLKRYIHLVRGYRSGDNLYGLSHTYESIIKRKRMIVFESEKSVMQLDTITRGQSYGVAICGKKMTIRQQEIIFSVVEYNPEIEVIIALDNDVTHYESREICKSLYALGILNLSYIKGGDKRLGKKDSISDSDLFSEILADRIKFKE